jgi:hypothetical protein
MPYRALWPSDCSVYVHLREDLVKRIALLLAFALVATPSFIRADEKDNEHHEDHDRDDRGNDHDRDDSKRVNAEELAGIGIGSAALLGVAGYLILRKRNASA